MGGQNGSGLWKALLPQHGRRARRPGRAPTSNQNVGVTMPADGDASKIQIPMPDKEKEPERYAAWENLMGHLKSGGNKGDGMCGDFQRGNCTRGANCKFSHGDIPTRGTQATDSKGVNMCNDFLKGDCFRGARCKFSHGDDPKNQTIGTGLNPQEAYGPSGGGPRGGYGGGSSRRLRRRARRIRGRVRRTGRAPRGGYGGGGWYRDSRDDYRDRRDRGLTTGGGGRALARAGAGATTGRGPGAAGATTATGTATATGRAILRTRAGAPHDALGGWEGLPRQRACGLARVRGETNPRAHELATRSPESPPPFMTAAESAARAADVPMGWRGSVGALRARARRPAQIGVGVAGQCRS